jgi:hypothetical protein
MGSKEKKGFELKQKPAPRGAGWFYKLIVECQTLCFMAKLDLVTIAVIRTTATVSAAASIATTTTAVVIAAKAVAVIELRTVILSWLGPHRLSMGDL